MHRTIEDTVRRSRRSVFGQRSYAFAHHPPNAAKLGPRLLAEPGPSARPAPELDEPPEPALVVACRSAPREVDTVQIRSRVGVGRRIERTECDRLEERERTYRLRSRERGEERDQPAVRMADQVRSIFSPKKRQERVDVVAKRERLRLRPFRRGSVTYEIG